MKKRTKLMLGMSAMLLATAGVAATGTFAWFSATVSATLNGVTDTASVAGDTTTSNLGTFTITPVLLTSADADLGDSVTGIRPSDTAGDVWVGTAGAKTTKVSANNAIETTYLQVKVKFTIAYSGPIDNANDIKTAFNDAAGNDFKMTISDASSYTAEKGFDAAFVTLAANGAKTRGTDFGLKFKTSAPTRASGQWANAGTPTANTKNELDSATFSLDLAGGDNFSDPANPSTGVYTASFTTAANANSYYIGVVGVDGVVQDSNDIYNFNVAISGGGITA